MGVLTNFKELRAVKMRLENISWHEMLSKKRIKEGVCSQLSAKPM